MNRALMQYVVGLCIAVSVSGASHPSAPLAARQNAPASKHRADLPWYVTAGAMHRVTLKPNTKFWKYEHLSLKRDAADSQLNAWKAEGIDSLEVFAPEQGGNSYNGLDAKNRYELDPGIGRVDDFRRLVRQAHDERMSIVTFQNLGYAALDAPQFMQAEEDVRAGRVTRESKFFYWSDRADARPPAKGNSYFLMRPSTPGYDAEETEFWQWSERAHHFYWTRWKGKDASGDTTHLPQYSWSSPEWPAEALHVIDFWMKTGIDGMVVDAVNWYAGYDWKKNAEVIAALRRHTNNKLMLPEGGGAFHTDDATGWIRDGAWSALYDYGVDIWWEKESRPMLESVNAGNPVLFEQSLQSYHDRVVAAGGILIQPVLDFKDPEKQRLGEGLLATSGDLPCYCSPDPDLYRPAEGIPALLKLKAHHAALYQNSVRRRIATNHDQTLYATLRYAADNSERLLIIFNFSAQPVNAQIDVAAINGSRFRDLELDEKATLDGASLHLNLSGYGHRIFRVEP